VGPESPHELRASDADREATVGRLRVAAMEGRLDAEELADRVSKAYDARWCRELEGLTTDITPPAAAASHAVAPPPVFVQPVSRVNGFAIASLVFGVAWFIWFGSVAAVVFGHVALRQIRNARGRQTGKGLAIAGLAFGYFGLLTLFAALVDAVT
jgi:threonine/homoserine/homoserine lactone efflux protein